MQVIKRDIILCAVLSACVAICALLLGRPFLRVSAGSGSTHALTQQAPTPAAAFKGTILRNGEQFLLRDSSGQVFRLDDPRSAQAFEGQSVVVTGKLDPKMKMIHVESIQPA